MVALTVPTGARLWLAVLGGSSGYSGLVLLVWAWSRSSDSSSRSSSGSTKESQMPQQREQQYKQPLR